MLNPSTADASVDDPTIRRCMGFSRRLGYQGMVVVNLFAWRSPKPSELSKADDPVGPDNNWHIEEAIEEGNVVANGQAYVKSEAALRIARELPRWQWTWVFR